MLRRRLSRKPRAYTLVELLLVIAIIALLAALLFAVFAPARRKSREAVCISNLRQLGLAFKMYQNDYGELPDLYPQLKDLVTDKSVLWCPQSLADAKSASSETQAKFAARFSSYWYNPEYADRVLPHDPPEKGQPTDEYISWAEAYRRRGESLPLLECTEHDINRLNPELHFTEGNLKIILRLDGSAGRSTAHVKAGTRHMQSWWEL